MGSVAASVGVRCGGDRTAACSGTQTNSARMSKCESRLISPFHCDHRSHRFSNRGFRKFLKLSQRLQIGWCLSRIDRHCRPAFESFLVVLQVGRFFGVNDAQSRQDRDANRSGSTPMLNIARSIPIATRVSIRVIPRRRVVIATESLITERRRNPVSSQKRRQQMAFRVTKPASNLEHIGRGASHRLQAMIVRVFVFISHPFKAPPSDFHWLVTTGG